MSLLHSLSIRGVDEARDVTGTAVKKNARVDPGRVAVLHGRYGPDFGRRRDDTVNRCRTDAQRRMLPVATVFLCRRVCCTHTEQA